MNSTSYDSARDWFRCPNPYFLPRCTLAHSSEETITSGERALPPKNRVVVSVVVLIPPDRQDFAPKTVLGLVHC
jgi:hypothetical protein